MLLTEVQVESVRRWRLPTAVKGSADKLMRRMRVLTGLELTPDNEVRPLDVTQWQRERDALGQE
jgi:hypothetical protein